MNGLWGIAFKDGLHDGINPCIFVACAVFIAHGLYIQARSLSLTCLRIIFVMAYVLNFLIFTFGPGQILIIRNDFTITAKIIYFVLGVWSLIYAVLFLKDWLLLIQGKEQKEQKRIIFGGGTAFLLTVIISLILSALATLSPVNNYILLLGNEVLLKGQWLIVVPLLLIYVLASMWPLWFVWALISIKNVRPSLLKVIYSAIFFTASSSIIFLFKK